MLLIASRKVVTGDRGRVARVFDMTSLGRLENRIKGLEARMDELEGGRLTVLDELREDVKRILALLEGQSETGTPQSD
jgi:hypothetical protein